MPGIVVDTHAIVWYLQDDPRLSTKATDALDAATAAGDHVYVPSICLVELSYLIEKRRLPASVRVRLSLVSVSQAWGPLHLGTVGSVPRFFPGNVGIFKG